GWLPLGWRSGGEGGASVDVVADVPARPVVQVEPVPVVGGGERFAARLEVHLEVGEGLRQRVGLGGGVVAAEDAYEGDNRPLYRFGVVQGKHGHDPAVGGRREAAREGEGPI